MKRPLLLLALSACGDSGGGPADGLSRRELRAEHRELVVRFAEAVVRKDYKAAFEETSADFRTEIGWDDFQESISRYRDRAPSAPTYTLSATEDDPKKIADDGVVQMLVSKERRSRIVEEVAVHFSVKGEEGWALICWIVDEGGAWKILNYYQDD